jgi:hypothetical protein
MRVIENFFAQIPGAEQNLRDTEVEMGLASLTEFQTPMAAIREPAYVGDPRHVVGDASAILGSAEALALGRKNISLVDTRFVLDTTMRAGRGRSPNGMYRMAVEKRKGAIADSAVGDAAPNLMLAQALSPWNVGYFQKVFKRPLLYSKALDLIKVESGTEPWCEVMDLFLADYIGFASLEDTGALSNNAVRNVNVKAGLMSSPVINMSSSYSLSIEEMKRAEQSGSPFGSQLITIKQRYADYVLRMLTAYLIYFGNTNTETVGLLNVPTSITSYGSTSMNKIFLSNVTNPGAMQLVALQGVIVPFLTALYNKLKSLKIVVSPICYNALTAPYSNTYSAESALKALLGNFVAGKTKDGGVPDIEFIIEPLFAPSTVFNSNTYDYMMLIASELQVGPDEEEMPLIMFGAPLMEFVYPTIPGSYETQYKFLKRVAGIFAPMYGQSVAVWTGFGTQGVNN